MYSCSELRSWYIFRWSIYNRIFLIGMRPAQKKRKRVEKIKLANAQLLKFFSAGVLMCVCACVCVCVIERVCPAYFRLRCCGVCKKNGFTELLDVNFTNVLHAAFTYVSFARSFFVLTFQVCTLLVQDCWRKSCVQNVDEIEPWCLESRRIRTCLPSILSGSRSNVGFEMATLQSCLRHSFNLLAFLSINDVTQFGTIFWAPFPHHRCLRTFVTKFLDHSPL